METINRRGRNAARQLNRYMYVQADVAKTIWKQLTQCCQGSPASLVAVLIKNPFSPTLFLIVAKMSLPKRSGPYWSNPPFLIFLTFGHAGTQSWAPECPNSKKWKRVGYTSMTLNTLNCNHLTPLGLKGLTSNFTSHKNEITFPRCRLCHRHNNYNLHRAPRHAVPLCNAIGSEQKVAVTTSHKAWVWTVPKVTYSFICSVTNVSFLFYFILDPNDIGAFLEERGAICPGNRQTELRAPKAGESRRWVWLGMGRGIPSPAD